MRRGRLRSTAGAGFRNGPAEFGAGHGYYTAPWQVPGGPGVTVSAVLQGDSSISGSASVAIQRLNALTISPGLSSVTTTQPLQLHVATACVTDADVTWRARGGAISSSGLYTPSGAAGSFAVTATLSTNPSVTGQATVAVTDFLGTLTWRNDNARSGVNSRELVLSPSTVNSATFGKLFSCPIDGYAYAQPLYVSNLLIPGNGTHNVVFVATEMDSVFAFDADTIPCKQLWMARLIPSGSEAVLADDLLRSPTPLIGPFVGITGTPVIDPIASILYVVAETQPSGPSIPSLCNPIYSHRLYALDLGTKNSEIRPEGVQIATLSEQNCFSSTLENQRPAMLLDRGTVYIAFGSYGGPGDYDGWLFAYGAASLQQTGVFSVTTGPFGGGIWQGGGGPSADSNHSVFVVTGDGRFDLEINPNGKSYGDSFLRFAPSGGLSGVDDYFTPCDQGAGQDVGASAPVLLPDSAGSGLQPHLLIGGSKDGSLYVVNRDFMGKYQINGCPDQPNIVQTIPLGGPILSTPIYWNDAVYVAPGNGHLMSLPMSQGILTLPPTTSKSQETFGPQGATPVISANGTGNAVLWLIDTSGAFPSPPAAAGPAVLRAYDPNDLSKELYDSNLAANNHDVAGPAVKFTVPTVANGKVYVGTQSELDVYGLLP